MKPYETPEIFELGAVESLTFGFAIIGPDDYETGWAYW
jgi:hypothetical protein